MLSVVKLPSCHAKWLSVIASKTFVQQLWLIFYVFEEQTGNNGGLMMIWCQNYAGISFNWNSWTCSSINIFTYTLASCLFDKFNLVIEDLSSSVKYIAVVKFANLLVAKSGTKVGQQRKMAIFYDPNIEIRKHEHITSSSDFYNWFD